MGKKWDSSGIAYSVELWTECLRVLKPGGHLLSFGGTRTYHRVAVAIEDAGFEIRDNMAWLYGSGFPKSLDVSKAIDKAAGVEREVVGLKPDWVKLRSAEIKRFKEGEPSIMNQRNRNLAPEFYKTEASAGYNNPDKGAEITAPATDEAQQWEGWGTALKPAHEPIIVARKPLIGTVANNVLTHGTGALNIDGSRIGTETITSRGGRSGSVTGDERSGASLGMYGAHEPLNTEHQGRWPANIILDEHTAGLLDEQSDASRFFYVAKASKRDRNEGLEGLENKANSKFAQDKWSLENMSFGNTAPAKNFHPTVKPTALMEYLVKLVTPPNGTVLDPFTGSGSTGKAAILNGFNFIGIEMTEDYLPIIEARLKHAEAQFIENQNNVLFKVDNA
jgi:site-specific DNA-methyltransferase (adenine-specific)